MREAHVDENDYRARTFRLENLRAFPAGVIETLSTTFSILIANRVFEAGGIAKASLVALPSLGLLLSLFVVQAVRRSGLSANHMLAFIFGVSGIGFTISSFAGDRFEIYMLGMVIALVTVTLNLPLFSQIYRRHYPDEVRGKLFSMTAFMRKAYAIGAAFLFGWLLTTSLDYYPLLLRIYAGASFMMAGCVLAIERVNLSRSRKVQLFDAFRHAGENQRFRRLLVSWMILGTGNLLSFSLFVEYVTNKQYGFDLSENHVSIITTVIPETCFFFFVLVWGRLFDRLDFYVLRCILNVFFAAGIVFYYMGDGLWALYIGIGLHGVAKAGGNIVWSLWVTKFADAEHVAEYMSVHTFLTGCRGVLAPFLAFPIAAAFGPVWVGGISVTLIAVATAIIINEIKSKDRYLPEPD
jgi:hypothetical protein